MSVEAWAVGGTEFWLDNGSMRIGVLSYGATVVEVLVPGRDGVRRNVALRLPDLAAYEARENRAYVGSTMGRFARVVPQGLVEIDGQRHQLTPNAGPDHIHGGPDGFDARRWSGAATGGEPSGRIVLSLTSPHGDQGYPGTLTCTAEFELARDDRLTIRYEATTDRPTLCGFSNHVFWNLAGTGTVDGQLLALNSGDVLEQVRAGGPDVVPTGRVVPVAPGQDFRAPRGLHGLALDDFFALTPGDGWAARLVDPLSGRRLVIGSDQTGMGVYSGDHLLGQPRAGVCIQPGPWPHTPGSTAAVLRPGQTYRSTTTFTFDIAEDAQP